jgi:adenosylcobinamide-GDP ribazoletransferase
VTVLDSWRLAVGTLTVLPVGAPRHVDARATRTAMMVAPAAAVPLGAAVAAVGFAGQWLGLPALVTGLLAVGALALGSRCLHLDGLSDTVDGLTASYDRERSLEVMKSGTAGPAGVVALVVVLGLQAGALAALVTTPLGPLLAGTAVIVSRAALVLCCLRGVPSARPDGLGGSYSGSVPRSGAALVWLLAVGALATAAAGAGLPWWRGVLAGAAAVVAVTVLLARTHRRLGGVTGDVFGAAVEFALTAALVSLT